MLKVYKKFFNRLNEEIPYVVWKAGHELEISLNGQGDIDLLVELEYRKLFKLLVCAQGFIHAKFDVLTFPFVEHFYGYDEETGKICHLHVYYKIITGESHIKSYHIPIEKEIIGNRFLNSLNVYEASYQDQALIYTLRHYMKRSCLISFIFWAYEKEDYLKEYRYIKDGLNSNGKKYQFPGQNKLREDLDFYCLDMGSCLSGYFKGKKKNSSIGCYRRFNALEASLKSVYSLGVRLFFKAFQTRKRPDKGLLLAICGVDGSGKSSMVKELHSWLGRDFDVKVLHLGKPSPVLITLPLRPLLFIYRFMSRKNRVNLVGPTDYYSVGTVKKTNGFVWGVRYLALAYERYRLACIAKKLAVKGHKIVICDRYPSNSLGKMDSPRIGQGGSNLTEKMRSFELKLYERIPKADGLVFLDVSEEEAIKRNRARVKKDKETDDEISFRHKDNQGLDFCANHIYSANANGDYGSVLKSLKSVAWECLLRSNKG